MKKLIAMAAALAVTSLSAFAVDITVGARGNFNMGIGTSQETYVRDNLDLFRDISPSTWEEGGNFGGGFGVYANFGMLNIGKGSFGIQPEFDMNFNNGYHFKIGEANTEGNFYNATIDIPILFTFTYPVMDALSIGGGLGPYFSIPVGIDFFIDVEGSKTEVFSDAYVSSYINPGVAFDVNGAYKLGPGSIVLDFRYMLDLTPTRLVAKAKDTGNVTDEAAYTRRILVIGLGYQMKF